MDEVHETTGSKTTCRTCDVTCRCSEKTNRLNDISDVTRSRNTVRCIQQKQHNNVLILNQHILYTRRFRKENYLHRFMKIWVVAIVFVSWISCASSLPLESEESILTPELMSLKSVPSSELTQKTSENKNDSKYPILQEIMSMKDMEPEEKFQIEEPKLQAVKKPRHKKCKGQYRKNYCMNGGKCEWITALKQPRCACKSNWKGERCQTYQLDFNQNEAEPRDQTLVISLVLSLFGVLGICLVGCICWRRVKFLQTHKDEIDENTAMVTCEKPERSNSVPR